jgi:site-specific recombinase XerD
LNEPHGQLSDRPSRADAWYVVRRRARDARIEAAIGNHSFRPSGLTDYMENGGDIKHRAADTSWFTG